MSDLYTTNAASSYGGEASLQLQSVYNGRTCIGFLMPRGRQGVEAFDADEHSLGIFPTAKAAADAISEVVP